MTKQEVISEMAQKSGLSKTDTAKALDAFTEVVTDSLKAGNAITLTGFGTFGLTEREPREGRNPATGEPIQIPACKTPKFKPGKVLKEAVN